MSSKGDEIKVFHAMSAFLKSYSSSCSQEDLLEARCCMGGLGYSYYNKMHYFININDV